MSATEQRLEDILNNDIWDVDSNPHITVDSEKCKNCNTKPCIRLCPAGCYTMSEKTLVFSYEGCVECGTCRVVCPLEAIHWEFPKSGRGIYFRFS
ncbi:MAG: 4Fe-4S dicluster domain-containing protein [Thaumarchaeota archaeon]|jgi:ferredoxin like protein|nr:4Fe-4S dicluster domain-containing protein [Nitrososphaerota archaeon]